jgi:hypothetical protein
MAVYGGMSAHWTQEIKEYQMWRSLVHDYEKYCDVPPTSQHELTLCKRIKSDSYLLEYNVVLSVESQQIFLRNVGWFSTDYTAFIPESITFHNYRRENLISYILQSVLSQMLKAQARQRIKTHIVA